MYGDPETALQNIDTLAKNGGSPIGKLVPSKQIIEKEIAESKKYGAEIILACEENYPSSLLRPLHKCKARKIWINGFKKLDSYKEER